MTPAVSSSSNKTSSAPPPKSCGASKRGACCPEKEASSKRLCLRDHSGTTAQKNVRSGEGDDSEPVNAPTKQHKGSAKLWHTGSAAQALRTVTELANRAETVNTEKVGYSSIMLFSSPHAGVPAPHPTYEEQRASYYEDPKRRKKCPPLPVPVPNLINKSRGRRVPTSESGSATLNGECAFVCQVEGCGRYFVRGEHLKWHVRSIHTYEKPHKCPYEGCGKAFGRRDNLAQHSRLHLPA
ncbi:hypothetical protein B0H11DRAFT_2270323 [Mycena galericulata]|nr:hypothetical protein B0H11DRAFT_2270323 [Mycena galericulata]